MLEQGRRVDPERVDIRVDGQRIITKSTAVYMIVNKERGVVSTMSDDQGRRSVGDYVADRSDRLFHVGRLDADTEGLLLLTNDGDLAHRLAHPSFGVPKTYLATVPGPSHVTLASDCEQGSSWRTVKPGSTVSACCRVRRAWR